ncbi:FUSC family protein [Burkholderia cenocepacia]|uniref:FUSC family protein n=1 Tax=Burkholderia cenocepacia TaxID=95486 RepID=UPI00196A38EC|nr:FUSC family protein [Burkholderia cenocepacia]MBN3534285.1 FUSC family protein [Burkholderia cenocepacia]MBR8030276.1 FUSC family protein [Burkholderia cenocepacia]MBR8174090.1 FUSC family protein [Burkholderia cenocepacia]MBR8428793.1 FUSC family protein [Burkholderia cenocepacia]MCW3543511.1 FUSC family protein [Burkholderia cenocepacia]
MRSVTVEKVFYSLRLYVSAVLALGVAFWQGFSYPYWAMTIVYGLIQPSGDQTRLKAGHVLSGTTVGAIAGVASAVLFATSPLMQLIALTLFLMAMSVGAFRDRRPRYYAFMLSGVTCLLIAMPGIATPEAAFERAVGRVQDVLLAIATFVVVDAILFPREQPSPAIPAVTRWLADLRGATVAALRAQPVGPQIRLGIVLSAIQLVPVADGASRSNTGRAWQYGVLVALIERGMRLLPVLTALNDLDQSDWSRDAGVGHRKWREALAAWIDAGCPDDARSEQLHRHLRVRPAWEPPYTLESALELCYLRYLRAIYAGWRRLQRDHGAHDEKTAARRNALFGGRPVPATIGQVDFAFAIRGALSIGLYAVLMGALWRATGWPASSMAFGMLMGMVFCITSGMADDPVLALVGPAKIAGIAMLTVGFYIQFVFPSVSAFPVLALALFPALFALGLVVQQQGGVLFAILPMALLRIDNGQVGITIDALLNSIIGLYIGLGMVVVSKLLIQRPDFVDVARRLMWRNRSQLRQLSGRASGVAPRRFLADALDLFVLLETRSAKLAQRAPAAQAGSRMLREIQIGRSITTLRRWAHAASYPFGMFATLAKGMTEWLNDGTDPLQPRADEVFGAQVEAQLHAMLATTPCAAVPVRSLVELRIALGASMSPFIQDSSRA